MNGKLGARPHDPAWARLLDAERQLEAEIAAARAQARARVAQARLTVTSTEPGALAAIASAQEQADIERHRGELALIAEQADTKVRALAAVPASRIDALAQLALDAVLTDRLAAEQR